MAHSIQHLRRSILPKTLNSIKYLQIHPKSQKPNSYFPQLLSHQPRNYSSGLSEIKKSAFENNLFRILRNEIQYELDHFSLPQPPAEFNGFKVVERPGEQWVSLGKRFGKSEEIKVEITMFDWLVPKRKPGEIPPLPWEKHQLHITLIISICKEKSNQVLEFICSAWRDNLEVKRLFVREQSKMPKNSPYTGPIFGELDPELQKSLYVFLKERGIDDNMCIFLHKYIHYKDKAEYIRWLESVKSTVEK